MKNVLYIVVNINSWNNTKSHQHFIIIILCEWYGNIQSEKTENWTKTKTETKIIEREREGEREEWNGKGRNNIFEYYLADILHFVNQMNTYTMQTVEL